MKRWTNRLAGMLFGAALLGGVMTSCLDDDFPTAGANAPGLLTRTGELTGDGSGLVQQEDGYWKATRRVPLVGVGRVVNNLAESLVSLGTYDKAKEDSVMEEMNHVVDTDLSNTYSPTSVLGTNVALNQIVSVLDLNYDYAGGQKAGFILKNVNNGVLSLDVLKGLWVDTYLNGVATGEHVEFSSASSLVDLGLGNITGGSATPVYTIETTFEKPFDEVRLGIAGVNVTLAQVSGVEVMYAYVGENPMIPAVNGGDALSTSYFKNKVSAPYGVDWCLHAEGIRNTLIDANTDNGIGISILDGLFQPRMTVDFGRTIPAGTEVGFYVTSGHLLDIGVDATTVVTTYNDEMQQESYSQTGVVELTLGGGGSTIFSLVTTKECDRVRIDFNGLNLDIGAQCVHYAFVREPTAIDVSSYFSFPNATVCTPSYRFADPEVGTVTYSVVSCPSNVERDSVKILTNEQTNGRGNVLTGMNVAGKYVIKAVYEYNGFVSEQVATITRVVKPKTNCNTPLTNSPGATPETAEYEAYQPEGFKGVIIGATGKKGDLSSVVNSNIDDSITCTDNGLNLIENAGLIGVRKKDGPIHTKGTKVRTGFVVNNKSHVLGLDVLRFMRIRLLNNGSEVQSNLADENNGISLSLVGESAGQVRLSIETNQEFDALELYSTGALTLNLGDEVTVYYAFIESADQDCGNPGEECMELLTNANYGAKASFSLKGLLSVTNQVQGLGFIVDNDMETYSTITVPVNLANAATIDVTFNTIKANQEVGFVLSDIPGLADVDLVKIVQVKAFYNDEFVGGSTDGTGADLKLFGSGDKKYFGITPGKDFNRLQLVTGEVLGVLSTYHVNGIYLKPDHDGDGVMDCVTDYASTEIVDLKVIPEDICLGDGVEFDVSGGVEGVTYTLKYYNQKGNTTDVIDSMEVQINETGGLKFLDPEAFHRLRPGEYYISVVHGDYELNRRAMLTIHPNETKWTGKKSNKWNDWENWTEGTPWECTNVFIPKSATYPNLCESDPGNGLCCNNIHFAPGAELVGQHLLNYVGSVFIDTKITAGKYQLMSVPLQGMVTGDMFVASNVASWEAWRAKKENGLHDRYFRLIDDDGNNKELSNYMEQRNNPFVFQRFWSKEVSNKSLTRASTTDPAIIQVNDWSRSFNAVGTPYALGQGFAMRLDGSGEYTFHFPKKHNAYFYYDKTGTTKLATDQALREGTIGRFILTGLEGGIVLTRMNSSGEYFLFGNPLMSHINIKKFLDVNKNVDEVKVYNGQEYVSLNNDNVSEYAQIAPMQAVFLKIAGHGLSTKVYLTQEMMEQGNGKGTLVRSMAGQLKLLATADGHTASCVMARSAKADDGYDGREDAPLLVESEEGAGVAVFTVAGGRALTVQQFRAATRIPVGFYMRRTGDVTLAFGAAKGLWQDWRLTDRQTGKSYPIGGKVTLRNVSTGTGRFYLEKAN